MRHNWQKDYPIAPNVSEAELGDNHSLVKVAQFVGENRRVVDFGCATGYLARLLNARGCKVTGLEVNPEAARMAEQHCERVIVADLDYSTLSEILPDEKFEVAIFADVLEHLRNPWDVLRDVRNILTDDGFVVASIPNVAHGAVRLALLNGKFQYEPLGLMDNTHLRFFTRKTVVELFEESGYSVDDIRRTVVPVFQETPLTPRVNRSDYPAELVQAIEQEEDASTLQFVLKAFPLTPQGEQQALQSRYYRLLEQHERLQDELKQARHAFDASQTELVQSQQQQTLHWQQQLQHSQDQLQHSQQIQQQQQQQFAQQQQQSESLQQALKETQQQYRRIQQELKQTSTALEEARSQSDQFQAQLQHAQNQLHQQQNQLRSLRKTLETREIEVLRAQDRIHAMETSKFWQIRLNWFRVKGKLGLGAEDIAPFQVTQNLPALPQAQPKETHPAPVQPPAATEPALSPYERWIEKHTPQDEDLKRIQQIASVLGYKPLISLVVPVSNPPEAFLREAIESVVAQVYPHWELCLAVNPSAGNPSAGNPSTEDYVRDILQDYAGQDDRIKLVFLPESGSVSHCLNSALEVAIGDYAARLDISDTLSPEALFEVAFLLNQHPEADMVYSDEDCVDDRGKRQNPHFKPEWSPDTFLSWMYTGHLSVYRRSLISELGGFRADYEGGEDYDLGLRFTEKTSSIFHVPKVLYHARISEPPADSSAEAEPHGAIAAQQALIEALQRRGVAAEVEAVPGYKGHYSIRYAVTQPGLVSIIIPTRDLGRIVNQCLESIFDKTTYPHYEVILVDNGSIEPYTEQVINTWLNREPERFRSYAMGIPFNYSKLNNFGVSKASGNYLLFLNNDTEVITPDWLEVMVGLAQRPSTGAVGSLLLYPDETIQHAGVVMGMGGVASHVYGHQPRSASGYFGQLLTTTNYAAVTGACLMCRRDVFEAVGGFNESLAVAFNDIDFCLRLVQQGYYNLCTPQAVLYHHESKSRGTEDTPEKMARFKREADYMWQTWKDFCDNDPFYSPHLSLKRNDYHIRE